MCHCAAASAFEDHLEGNSYQKKKLELRLLKLQQHDIRQHSEAATAGIPAAAELHVACSMFCSWQQQPTVKYQRWHDTTLVCLQHVWRKDNMCPLWATGLYGRSLPRHAVPLWIQLPTEGVYIGFVA